MAFIEGQRLKQRIAEGPLPIGAAVRIATEVAEGLKAAHARGIVHRDIKPANIMLAASGQATIMDFGLAKLERAAELTRTATIVGTALYMPPERRSISAAMSGRWVACSTRRTRSISATASPRS